MPVGLCVVRNEPSYRKEFFIDGLRAAGFDVVQDLARRPNPGDVLIVWNRHPAHDRHARRYLDAGARVIVAENGWTGRGPDGHKLYAMCLDHHNGPGRWCVGSEDRWAALKVELAPWRQDGEHILVLPQRGIGEHGVAMDRAWPRDIVRRLRQMTKRPIRLRPHPGDVRSPTPIERDLKDCWAAVTWGSGAGIKAIIAGVPVFYELKRWIGHDAAKRGIEEIENPFLGDRLPMLRRMAWAMWSSQEIATGEPIRCLLELPST